MEVVIPSHLVKAYQAANADDLADLASAGRALKAKGMTSAQIADRFVEAGWDKGFAVWYSQMLDNSQGELNLVVPAVVEVPVDNKRESAKQTGALLAGIATAWSMGWPFLGITGLIEQFVAAFAATAFLWEGFARLAYAKGLSRIHGVSAILVVIMSFAVWSYWISFTEGKEQMLQDFALPIIITTVAVPISTSWLVYKITTGIASKKAA